MKKIIVIAVLLMLVASAAGATNWTTYLTGYDVLTSTMYATTLSADVMYSAGLYTYEYTLTNDAGLSGYADYLRKIDGFTIDFTGANAATVVVDLTTPSGWVYSWDTGQGTLNWDALSDSAKLAPGASKLFRYTSNYAPGVWVNASAEDGIGFSGATIAPVPEPMSMILGAIGLVSVGGFKRLRRK